MNSTITLCSKHYLHVSLCAETKNLEKIHIKLSKKITAEICSGVPVLMLLRTILIKRCLFNFWAILQQALYAFFPEDPYLKRLLMPSKKTD